MKIALIGYGKMGKMIDEISHIQGHQVVARVQKEKQHWEDVAQAELCIEFTHPNAAISNIQQCCLLKKNVVVGTTGWYDRLPEIETLAQEIGILYGPNFSLGVLLWLKIIKQSALLMEHFTQYEVSGIEWHHKEKRDAPSGTAQAMGKMVEEEIERVKNLTITSVRRGTLCGTHSLIYDSPVDAITITHEARNRHGFAQGALLAAEWLKGKVGLFTWEDMWKDVLPL